MTNLLALETLARPQAGVVGRAQLEDLGWSGSRIDRAYRTGALHGVAPGVYRCAGAPWTRHAAHHAAALLVAPTGALARWTAAELHGFCEPRGGPAHAVVPHDRRRPAAPRDLVRIRRSRRLEPASVVAVAGLPVTTPALTLLHLAGMCTVPRLGELAAAALRAGVCSHDDVAEVVTDHPAAAGRGRLRQALGMLGDDAGESRSDVEVAAVVAILQAGLPRPVLAHRARDRSGRFLGEIDLAYPELLLAIEIDGFRWHSSPHQKRSDEERQNALVVAGWTVLRFMARDVRERPQVVVATIRAALVHAGVEV